MINVLLTTTTPIEELKFNPDETIRYNFDYVLVPEMNDVYSIMLYDEDLLDEIEVLQGVDIIGAYNEIKKVKFDEEGEAKPKKEKHSKSKYNSKLKDVPDTYDEEGNVTKWKKAKDDSQVNKFLGWPDRNLTNK